MINPNLLDPTAGIITEPVSPDVSHSVVLRRREDLLWLRFDFFNLWLERGGTPKLGPRGGQAGQARVVVHFPPQAVFEQAIPYDANDQKTPPYGAAVRSRLAGSSRLAFSIDTALLPLPYTVEALLDWEKWTPLLSLGAQRAEGDGIPMVPSGPVGLVGLVGVGPGGPGSIAAQRYRPVAPPPLDNTSIEAPWWLQISPNRRSGWVHAAEPVGKGNPKDRRYELWHTRLATRRAGDDELTEEPTPDRIIRAIWSPDPETADKVRGFDGPNPPSDDDVPFLSSMTQKDRLSLIALTTDYGFRDDYEPEPVTVNHLDLSALGARLDVHGRWPDLKAFSLLEWRHRSTLGRDQYVRVVDRGCLCTKHPCIKVEITDRRFLEAGAHRVAPLIHRQFLIVTRPVIDFTGDDGDRQRYEGRALPFRSLRIHNVVTPPINDDQNDQKLLPNAGSPLDECFFPTLTGSGADYLWHITATDWDDREHEILMPLLWMPADVAEHTGRMPDVREAWNNLQHDERGWARLNGRRVAYAKPLDDRPDSTAVTTQKMRVHLSGVVGEEFLPEKNDFFVFFPELFRAEVRLEGVEALTANPMGSVHAPESIAYHGTYKASGFEPSANGGGVWAELVDENGDPDPPSLRFSRDDAAAEESGVGADRAGAVMTPDLAVSGLSRSLGLVGGNLDTLTTGGEFTASDFFGGIGTQPKLLGGVLLSEVIEDVPLNGQPDDAVLRIETTHDGDIAETTMRWRPELKTDNLGIFDPGKNGTARIDAVQRTNLGGGIGSSVVEGEIRTFALNVPGGVKDKLLRISFHRLAFISRDGKKPDVDVDVADVKFQGELEWIERLDKYLNFAGDGGPEINILPDRIEALVGVPIPSITLGVFALHSISFRAGFDLPFTGDPARLRFALSSRENNFHLTVLGIGGGGYVDLAWGVDGLERLEIGFEGGAEVMMDFGPVTAGVGMMFGIQTLYQITNNVETVRLRGYFALYGEVDLGPVSVSAGLYFMLQYEVRTKNGKSIKTMYGQGRLYIEVSIPLVPFPSIDIMVEKNFKSDENDPTFGEKMPALPGDPQQSAAWNTYCDAFAGVLS